MAYLRHPTVFSDTVVFVSEDDLWSVPLTGGVPRRLTSGLGRVSVPAFSRDGKQIAFSSEEEGHKEIFLMDAAGGEPERITYLGGNSNVVGWTHDNSIIFTSNYSYAYGNHFFTIKKGQAMPVKLSLGQGVNLDFSENGKVVLERNSHRPDLAHWKRYRGGTSGKLWISDGLDKNFSKLLTIPSNFSKPMFVKNKIYFLSDHEGIGDIYSCDFSGKGIKRHTHSKKYYARNPSTDGKTIVFHSGGDISYLNIKTDEVVQIPVDYRSHRTQRTRKFVATSKFLERAKFHPKGHLLAVTSRGKVHTMGPWGGPVVKFGKNPSVRYRFGNWMNADDSFVYISDDGGEEIIERVKDGKVEKFSKLPIGRVTGVYPSPTELKVALTNHKNELLVLDLTKKKISLVHRNEFGIMHRPDWSPDGKFLVFGKSFSYGKDNLAVYELKNQKLREITVPFFNDSLPVFDPDGKYIYFLSVRVLNPVVDSAQFNYSFPRTIVPCLITLKKDTPNPFLPQPRADDEAKKKEDREKSSRTKTVVEIDFDQIESRILSFPVKEDLYENIQCIKGKVYWSKGPLLGRLGVNWLDSDSDADTVLESFDLENLKTEIVHSAINDFDVCENRKWMLLYIGKKIRVVKTNEKIDSASGSEFTPKAGWVDLDRIKTLIEPAREWKQMLREVWRLQRDHFWRADMSNVPWDKIYELYAPLVEKANTRTEFSDLVWELQGELGTSHAYDIGGDYRLQPQYRIGFLGADYSLGPKGRGYQIEKIYKGDFWNKTMSPLLGPGIEVSVGDTLLEINGDELGVGLSPFQALLNRAGQEVEIKVFSKTSKKVKRFVVKTLTTEVPTLYRDWVDGNRKLVWAKSKGKIGYIHIPDMSVEGFSEFHRSYLAEYEKLGLIVDVRHNGGGNVSQLILEKLSRPRYGLDITRWFGQSPIPGDSPTGNLVAITDEYAGSDGDIFSHTFKLRKLGPLIGKRTWGGVVGIWPRHRLVDGSVTTQPEFATWFSDVEFGVENYGTDPDIDVEFAPHDYRIGCDPQLERALKEVLKIVEKRPALRPKAFKYPNLRAPHL